MAAMTKSAQIPFSAWLPAAIAAPTPVSSLVHSSTLVTAGVYLLIRFNELVGVNIFLLYISVFTIVISGFGANLEMDLKKIIALSTLRQLGVIIITLSLGLVELTYFHLISHALFKSLLFLCAGVYIHRFGDVQDIRGFGGVGSTLPLTSLFFVGCSLSLCGFPYLSGFYSKDLILESFFIGEINLFIFIIIFFGTLATVSYSVRLVYYIFIKNLGFKRVVLASEELFILGPIRVLFCRSTIIGSIFNWFFISPGRVILPFTFKILILLAARLIIFGVINLVAESLGFIVFNSKVLIILIGGIWFLPYLSTIFFIRPIKIGFQLIKFWDQG